MKNRHFNAAARLGLTTLLLASLLALALTGPALSGADREESRSCSQAEAAEISRLALMAEAEQGERETGPIYLLSLTGTITGGNVSYVRRAVIEAGHEDAEAVIIQLNTPGGLVDATFNLIEAFFEADVPIVVYVSPSGAMAASAGAFILVSSDYAAMAPGTSVGAAQPISLTPEGEGVTEDKTIKFMAEQIRGFAEKKDRPGDIAERFVTENLTLTYTRALEEGLIDGVHPSLENLLQDLDGKTVVKRGEEHTINTEGAQLVEPGMNLRERLQNWVSDPQIAFLLFMLGVLLLYVGFSNPGTFVPEVLGGIALVMAVFGMGLFEIHTTGIILILLGIGLIIAELFVAGFGILGIGGAASLLIGALLLPLEEPLIGADWYRIFVIIVVGTVVAFTLIILVVVQRIISTRRYSKEAVDSIFNPPEEGVVVKELNPEGLVRARGETWRALSADGAVIPEGKEVAVESSRGLVLLVKAKS